MTGEMNLGASMLATRFVSVASTLAGSVLLAACTTADPQIRIVAQREQMCTACHGIDGTTRAARSPILAGQPQPYIVAQLKAFHDHDRADAAARDYMWPMAAGLSDPMIESLATYFSSLPPVPGEHPQGPEGAAGQAFYEKGAADRGIPACGSCHGDKAQGMAVFPRLAGQHEDYLLVQLAAFADGSRANPIMGPIAMKMTAAEIQSVAAHLAAQ